MLESDRRTVADRRSVKLLYGQIENNDFTYAYNLAARVVTRTSLQFLWVSVLHVAIHPVPAPLDLWQHHINTIYFFFASLQKQTLALSKSRQVLVSAQALKIHCSSLRI